MNFRYTISFVVLLFIGNILCAQSTRVKGVVTDVKTGELLPLVNVFFKGTTVGITTDFNGGYSIETREDVDEVSASYVGYFPQTIKIKKGIFNTVDFQLEAEVFALNEIRVTPGVNPAHAILDSVNKNKYRNDPSRFPEYFCKTYTKMELDLTNIKPGFKNKTLQKNFGFVFDHMDTSVVTGKAYLPVMISESSADYYFRKSPSLSREIVKASRISGIEEDYTLAQFTGHLHANVNLYDNYIDIFEVLFASPLSDHGKLYYKYFLVDSLDIDGRKTYKIRFHPKSFSTPVLDGEISIDSASWALQAAQVKMVKGLNVNWIRNMMFDNENQMLNDSTWFPKREKIFADFSLFMSDSSKVVSFLGRREVNFSDVNLNPSISKEVLKMNNNVMYGDDVLNDNELYWDSIRPYKLSEKEKGIYIMVDSIKDAPLYKTLYDMIDVVMGGYYNMHNIDIGPYYKLLSFNEQEGARFQLGFKTRTEFSKKIRLKGYAAYGVEDERWKGGGGVDFLFNELPTSLLSVKFKHDFVQLGSIGNVFTGSNIFSSILSRGGSNRLSMVNQFNIDFEKEWREGRTTTLGVQVQDIFSNDLVPFIKPDGEIMPSIQSTILQLNTRLSKNEIVIRKTFDKHFIDTKYPVFGINLAMGVKGIFENDYEFYRLIGSVNYTLPTAPVGYSKISLSGGKIFGKVPYPLLKLHEGNPTYFYSQDAFSCMNFYEFASDAWVSLFYEHHFRGFFLGKIPIMKRLNWREVVVFKSLIGTLSDKNNGSMPDSKAVLLFPDRMSSVSKPYFETGVGIENIFRIFRVDAVWRLTHRDNPPEYSIPNFTINFSVHLNF